MLTGHQYFFLGNSIPPAQVLTLPVKHGAVCLRLMYPVDVNLLGVLAQQEQCDGAKPKFFVKKSVRVFIESTSRERGARVSKAPVYQRFANYCVIRFGNNIVVDPYRIYACIAPVGGHTCITAGERSEPAD